MLKRLEEGEDINEINDYFSYEHFYVVYCKFWELDTDHDMVISQQDLSCYANGSISDVMIERLFSGCITHGASFRERQMSYVDFVWFLLSEVDKSTPTCKLNHRYHYIVKLNYPNPNSLWHPGQERFPLQDNLLFVCFYNIARA